MGCLINPYLFRLNNLFFWKSTWINTIFNYNLNIDYILFDFFLYFFKFLQLRFFSISLIFDNDFKLKIQKNNLKLIFSFYISDIQFLYYYLYYNLRWFFKKIHLLKKKGRKIKYKKFFFKKIRYLKKKKKRRSKKKIIFKFIKKYKKFFNFFIFFFIKLEKYYIKNLITFFFFFSNFFFNKFLFNIKKEIFFFLECFYTNNFNHSIKILTNYICIRLKQQFYIFDILKPIFQHLKKRSNILGFKIKCSGRFTRKDRSAKILELYKQISLNKIKANINYTFDTVILKYSLCSITIWIHYI